MSILSVAQVKEAMPELSWSDDTIQMAIDANEAMLDEAIGPIGSDSRLIMSAGDMVFLPRPAASVDAVTEWTDDSTSTVLASDDYEVWYRGRAIRRLNTGTNPRTRWGFKVNVTFTPKEEPVQRAVALTELIRIDYAYAGGAVSRTMGSWSESTSGAPADRQRERANVVSRYIASTMGMVYA